MVVKQQTGEPFFNAKNGWTATRKLLLGGLWNVRTDVFLNYVGSKVFKVGGKWKGMSTILELSSIKY
jgi:hypothetical protein